MAEEIAAASVRIIPDFSTFDAAVLAHAQKAAQVIEAAVAKAKIVPPLPPPVVPPVVPPIPPVPPPVIRSYSQLNTVLGQTGRLLIPIGVAFTAIAVKAVLATSAIVEAVNAVNVAFGESSGEIQAFAQRLQTTESFFGLTERAALDAAATFGLFLNDIVRSEPILANLSEQLIKAGADVGSLFNVSTNKVIKDFQSGLAGQTRAVRKYGLDISEATTKQEAFRLGLAAVGDELTEEDKRLSRLSLILHGSAVAAGDAELTQNTFAGAVRNTQVALGGAIAQLGQQLLPIAKTVVENVGRLASAFGNLSGFSQRLIIAFGLIATAAGPILLIGSKLIPIFTALVPAIQAFVASIQAGTLALGPQLAILALVAAAILALKFALDAPTKAAETAKDFQQLAKDAQNLNRATADGAEAAKKYRESLEKLGLKDIDFTSFDDIVKKIDIINEKLAQGPEEKERKGAGGIFKFTDELAAGIDSIITGMGDTAFDIGSAVLGNDPDKAITQLDGTTEAIGALKTMMQAKNLPDAQALIASTKDLAIRKQLQAVYDEEIKLLAARTIKQKAADDEATRALQLAIDQQDPTEKLNKLFAESVENMERLLTAQTAVTSAEKSLRSANAAAGKARDRLNKLLRDGAVDAVKVKNAEDALTDATNRRVEAEKEVIKIKLELAKLELPATADELSEATDNITKAEIALTQAQRDRAEAMKALEPRQVRALNLAGLTLDQLRTTLANERATLAAKRAQKGVDEDSPEEKAEKAVLASIAEREAERNLGEARKDLTELQKKGSDSDEEVIEKREELTRATTASTKASREELDARKKLNEVSAGDPEFEGKVAEARQAVADAGENAADAADRLKEANIKLWKEEQILAGNLKATNIEMAARLVLNRDLLQQQKDNDAFIRQFEELLRRSAIFPFGPGLPTTHDIAMSLINDPNSPFREIFKRLGIPLAEGAVIDRPMLHLFGESGREGAIPFTKPKRAATLLVGAREFPAIEEEIAKIRMSTPGVTAPTRTMGSGGRGFTLDRSRDSDAVAVLQEILRHLKSRPESVPIDVHPAPGMDEGRLARKVQREIARYWGNG